jgi:hypothetical protein
LSTANCAANLARRDFRPTAPSETAGDNDADRNHKIGREHHLGIGDERARDREHLLLAAGKLTPVEPPTKFDLII